jgi:hypothetical protein
MFSYWDNKASNMPNGVYVISRGYSLIRPLAPVVILSAREYEEKALS